MTGRKGSPVYCELLSIIMYLHTFFLKNLKTYVCMYFISVLYIFILLKAQEEMTN